MNNDTDTTWVFEPVPTFSNDQLQIWDAEVYVENAVDLALGNTVRSVVVTTYPGCGITTSLHRLRSPKLLLFSYNPEQWPGQPQALSREDTHFGQWMGHIADVFADTLRANPNKLNDLDPYQHQFVIWLLESYRGRRQGMRWRTQLQSALANETWTELARLFEQEPIEYTDTSGDIKSQIEECVDVARKLGWLGIFATIDIRSSDLMQLDKDESAQFASRVHDLLTILVPLESSGFGIKLGLPSRLLQVQEVDRLSRSRVKPIGCYWNQSQLQAIILRVVKAAKGKQAADTLSEHLNLWDAIIPDIHSIWGTPGPAAATLFAQAWLEYSTTTDTDERLRQIRAHLYRLAAPLRLDHATASQVVWRGQHPIELDDVPYRLFYVLWKHQGSPALNEELIRVAGTKANLDKIVSRLRQKIEPLYEAKLHIYIQRNQSSGTWLNEDLCIFS